MLMNESKLQTFFKYGGIIAVALVFLLPLILMFFVSLQDPKDSASGFSIPPRGFHLQNYSEAWQATNFPRQFINSLIMSLGVTLGQILTSLMAGYAFARIEFFGKKMLFFVILGTIII